MQTPDSVSAQRVKFPIIHSVLTCIVLLLVALMTPMAFAGVPAPPPLVINEIMQNPAAVGDSDGEWFEIYNPTGTAVDINGWTIRDDGSDTHLINNGGPLLVPAGGYAVLGNNANSGTNGGVSVDYSYNGGFFLSNSADELILEDTGSNEADRVEWDGGPAFPDPTGASMSLIDPTLDNNVGANWCTASTSYGDGDQGTPGSANDCSVVVPGVVINEIMQNPSAVGDSDGEWFEIYNPTGDAVDIDGWTIRDDGSDSHLINNGGPLLVPAGGYAVLGNNADSGTNGGVTVDYSYNGGFFLSNSADELILEDGGSTEVDRVEWDGGPAFPDPTGASMSLRDPALDNNVGANWCTSTTSFGAGDKGTPGSLNNCDVQPIEAFIHDVQGSGASVAITDLVIVEAIVVGDFQDTNLNAFFIQEEDADADGDAATSEGILVFCGGCGHALAVGDKVQVTGWPGEFFNMSQIDAAGSEGVVTVVGVDTLPTPSTVDLPTVGSTVSELTLEPVEGMLVTFPDTLVVSEYFQLARFGQLVLTVDERARQFTDANEPDVDGYAAFLADLSSRRIILDDDNNVQNYPTGTSPDEPYYWPRPGLSTGNLIRGGDSIVNLTGVMHWSWAGSGGTDAWRIRPVDGTFGYDFTPNIPRPAAPDAVGGSLKVASFNVLNYFSTIDEGPNVCGPVGGQDCRGADSEAELVRQRDKIVSALITMDADVIGLMEQENNASAASQHLVDGLNAVAGTGVYDFVDTGTIGDDAIKVGFVYKTTTVTPVGDFAILDSSVDPTFNDDKNRPALAQTFEEFAGGGKLTVAVNHLKSKGSPCDDVGDPNLNDGQANCNQTRTDAAIALVNWLATDPTNSGDPDYMIIGDLNSYRMEDPIDALKTGGYTDLLDAVIGPNAYTYLFDGQLGYLDYAMANDNLTWSGQVTGVTAWNINADEIPLFDYNDEIRDSGEASFERESGAEVIFEDNAYRASDHDPVLIGLNLANPMGDKEDVMANLGAHLPTGDKNTDRRLNKAIDSIAESLDPAWWTSDQSITDKKVFDNERAAVVQLELIVTSDVPGAGAAMAAIDVLVNADRQLAQIELIAAIVRGGDAFKIAEAEAAMADAAALTALGLYNEAVNAYKAAWDAATKA